MSRCIDLFIDSPAPLEELATALGTLSGLTFIGAATGPIGGSGTARASPSWPSMTSMTTATSSSPGTATTSSPGSKRAASRRVLGCHAAPYFPLLFKADGSHPVPARLRPAARARQDRRGRPARLTSSECRGLRAVPSGGAARHRRSPATGTFPGQPGSFDETDRRLPWDELRVAGFWSERVTMFGLYESATARGPTRLRCVRRPNRGQDARRRSDAQTVANAMAPAAGSRATWSSSAPRPAAACPAGRSSLGVRRFAEGTVRADCGSPRSRQWVRSVVQPGRPQSYPEAGVRARRRLVRRSRRHPRADWGRGYRGHLLRLRRRLHSLAVHGHQGGRPGAGSRSGAGVGAVFRSL